MTRRLLVGTLTCAVALSLLPGRSHASRESSLAPIRWQYRLQGVASLHGMMEPGGAYHLRPTRRAF